MSWYRSLSSSTFPPLERFLAGPRAAWADGEARPTAEPPERPKRERRRPDPLVKVTELAHNLVAETHTINQAKPTHALEEICGGCS